MTWRLTSQCLTDTSVAFDIAGANSAGGIYRTYLAAFYRTPEKTGLGYWIDRADNGANGGRICLVGRVSNALWCHYQ